MSKLPAPSLSDQWHEVCWEEVWRCIKNLDEGKAMRCQVWNLYYLCSQAFQNQSLCAISSWICLPVRGYLIWVLWLWFVCNFGAEAQEEEPISHVRRKQCLCKATRHQPPVPTEAALQNAKCQGWGGCAVALTVCGGGRKVNPMVISTFPSRSQPSLKWVLLICCALSAQGVGKLQ